MKMEYVLTLEKYRNGLTQGKFLGLHCKACDTYSFPPTGVCPGCSGSDMEITEMSGEGALRTFTVIRVAPQGKKPPYVVAMVELKEGPWVMGNLVDFNLEQANLDLIGKSVRLGSQLVPDDTAAEGESPVVTFTLAN
jgi:uncharacterized OB-fold protein